MSRSKVSINSSNSNNDSHGQNNEVIIIERDSLRGEVRGLKGEIEQREEVISSIKRENERVIKEMREKQESMKILYEREIEVLVEKNRELEEKLAQKVKVVEVEDHFSTSGSGGFYQKEERSK